MKNSLFMSLLFVLTFWSSYSSANYLDDQVLKYCKTFMVKRFGSNFKNFTYSLEFPLRKTKKVGRPFATLADYECWCVVNNETTEYIVNIWGWKSSKNHIGDSWSGRIQAHNTAELYHSADKFIPVGAIEYTQNVFYLTKRHLIMYVAIVHIETPNHLKFDQGTHSVN